jgi:hypothetical protein
MIFVNIPNVFAQEWRVLVGKGVSQKNEISLAAASKAMGNSDWLAPQTPLLKNAPLTNVSPNPRPIEGLIFNSGYSQTGSWSSLASPTEKEGFTLLSF